MNSVLYPSLYQINTRVWRNQLSGQIGRPATLDDIPDAGRHGDMEFMIRWKDN